MTMQKNREPTPTKQPTDDAQREAAGQRATRFDGNPNPKPAPSDTFEPKDDTPVILDKKKGPKNPEP